MHVPGMTRSAAIGAGLFLALMAVATDAPEGIAAVDSCSSISPRSLQAYGRTIASAHRYASADASRYGTDGAYAVAGRNSRDLLKRAQDRADAAVRDLNTSNPAVPTAAEAGTVKEHVRAILEVVPQAAHWSMVSEIDHESS